jgi:hypothetical protein
MKTIYLIKSFVPFVFLPFAPGVVQMELERMGLLSHGSGSTYFALLIQIAFSAGIVWWLVRTVKQKNAATASKAFLKMSCVSKKVFHNGTWMSVEQYLADHHNVVVSHGMTPEEATDWMRESQEFLEREAKAYAKTEVSVS